MLADESCWQAPSIYSQARLLLQQKRHEQRMPLVPDYQNKGVTALIFDEYYKTFSEKGIRNCIRTPELLENNAIHLLWKNFDPKIHCQRKTYLKK